MIRKMVILPLTTVWQLGIVSGLVQLPADPHFHDLWHSGNHLAASSGTSTRELMGRL
jgi:hypothetical protein